MAESAPSQRVLEQLIPLMSAKGFAYRKKSHVFWRKVEQATHQFRVGFNGRGGFVSTDASIFVNYDQLDALCEKVYGCKGEYRVAGGDLLNSNYEPWQYNIFVSKYSALTPREKGAVDPALVHPQERIDGAVRFLIEAYDKLAEPLFRQLHTHRQLADMWLQDREPLEGYRLALHGTNRITIAPLLSAGLGDDPGWARADVDRVLTQCPLRLDLAEKVEKLRRFIDASDPADLLFD